MAPAAASGEARLLRFTSLPPLSLYVHLPWCVHKCPYCDFNSYEARGETPEQQYVDALLRDLDGELAAIGARVVETIFIGGGTPSLFSAAAIARLLDGIRARCALARDAEVTLEANPGAIEAERFLGYRAAGVNRLSIGIQSLRNAQLRALGRVHDAAEAEQAIATARAAGFDNVNVDLMYGLPQDDVDGCVEDLERALAWQPTHVSWYQLTLEPNTAFAKRPPTLASDALVAAMEARGRAALAEAGYERYEVSAYARPGRRSAHNLNYWRFGDYIGIGAGAHGKITRAAEHAIERRMKTRNPRTYMELAGKPTAVKVERIDEPRQVAIEFLLNALRLTEGVSEQCFAERAGQPVGAIAVARAEAERRGWLAAGQGRVCTTPQGFEVLNRVLELFV